MGTMLAPVDIEAAVIAMLKSSLDLGDISTEVFNPRPTGPYIRVTRAGGTRLNLVQSRPRVLIECWDPDENTAFDLAARAWAALDAAQDSWLDENTYATEISSTEPVNFPDAATKVPRYQFITTVTASLAELLS